MYLSFKISDHDKFSWTLLPVYSSDLLFHLKNIRLRECTLIKNSDCFIITSCYKSCLIRRPALRPKLAFVVACHNRLDRRIFLSEWKLINWWGISTNKYLIFIEIHRKNSWVYCVNFWHLKYNTITDQLTTCNFPCLYNTFWTSRIQVSF
jgi:hypothetical protein